MSAAVPCHASGGTVANPAFQDLIARHGLRDFERLMRRADGTVIKHAIAQRKTVRLDLPGGPAVYLKRHYPSGFFSALKKLFSPEPTALDEFLAIEAFHQSGIPTVTAIAAGRRAAGFLRTESFLVTLGLEGCTKLEDVLARPLPREEKEGLISKAAQLVKKMHAAGFNHRDLYLCHILCDAGGDLSIVDLHRVQRRSCVPRRWLVKDLAALNYSAPPRVSRADRLRFMKEYLGAGRLGRFEKDLLRSVLKKSRSMGEHNRKRAEN